jgi:hypothetical protein
VSDYLQKFRLSKQEVILDPFCGTGTTLVEAKFHGIPSIGVEAHPMAHFASQVKTDWGVDADALLDHATSVASIANEILESDGVRDESFFQDLEERDLPLRTLEPERARLLLENSISPIPLHKTLVLLDCLRSHKNERYHNHELLALARSLVQSVGNLRFGPEVGIGKVKSDVPVLGAWLNQIKKMASDLRVISTDNCATTMVHLNDARHLSSFLEPHSIDAIITSPPYPNEKDYTRTTRLETVLLGFINSKQELRDLKRTLLRSNTRTVYKGDEDDQWILSHPEIQRIADAIEKRRIDLKKTSGFERLYPKVTKLYFGGMARHLADLRTVLRPGAQLAYVVGDQASYLQVMIRTGQLLAHIAKSLGYQLVDIELFRTRLATATREQLREEVVVLRWPG